MSAEAPFRADLAMGPPGGRARWLTAADGMRLRAGFWGGGPRGTVVVLSGRAEYAEKYGPTAAALLDAGWSTIVPDWRGQGFSGRLLPDPMIGHVGSFAEYQRDLDAVIGWLMREGEAAGLRQPFVMLAHSMGGLIGWRALVRGLPLVRAVLSAPMWGLVLVPWKTVTSQLLSRLPFPLAADRNYVPGAGPETYVLCAPFEGNQMTSSRDGWDWLALQAREEPAFRLGGPSIGWLRAALREIRALDRRPAPSAPVLAVLGDDESVVSPSAVRRRIASWPDARLVTFPGARHEILIERADLRDAFLREAVSFLGAASAC